MEAAVRRLNQILLGVDRLKRGLGGESTKLDERVKEVWDRFIPPKAFQEACKEVQQKRLSSRTAEFVFALVQLRAELEKSHKSDPRLKAPAFLSRWWAPDTAIWNVASQLTREIDCFTGGLTYGLSGALKSIEQALPRLRLTAAQSAAKGVSIPQSEEDRFNLCLELRLLNHNPELASDCAKNFLKQINALALALKERPSLREDDLRSSLDRFYKNLGLPKPIDTLSRSRLASVGGSLIRSARSNIEWLIANEKSYSERLKQIDQQIEQMIPHSKANLKNALQNCRGHLPTQQECRTIRCAHYKRRIEQDPVWSSKTPAGTIAKFNALKVLRLELLRQPVRGRKLDQEIDELFAILDVPSVKEPFEESIVSRNSYYRQNEVGRILPHIRSLLVELEHHMGSPFKECRENLPNRQQRSAMMEQIRQGKKSRFFRLLTKVRIELLLKSKQLSDRGGLLAPHNLASRLAAEIDTFCALVRQPVLGNLHRGAQLLDTIRNSMYDWVVPSRFTPLIKAFTKKVPTTKKERLNLCVDLWRHQKELEKASPLARQLLETLRNLSLELARDKEIRNSKLQTAIKEFYASIGLLAPAQAVAPSLIDRTQSYSPPERFARLDLQITQLLKSSPSHALNQALTNVRKHLPSQFGAPFTCQEIKRAHHLSQDGSPVWQKDEFSDTPSCFEGLRLLRLQLHRERVAADFTGLHKLLAQEIDQLFKDLGAPRATEAIEEAGRFEKILPTARTAQQRLYRMRVQLEELCLLAPRDEFSNMLALLPPKEERERLIAEIRKAHEEMDGPSPKWPPNILQRTQPFLQRLRELRIYLADEIDPSNIYPELPQEAERLVQEIDLLCARLGIPSTEEVVLAIARGDQNRLSDQFRQQLLEKRGGALFAAASKKARTNQAAIIKKEAARLAQLMAKNREHEIWRSLAAFLGFAIIAMHSPLCNRPRTFLTFSVVMASLAAWHPELEKLLNILTHQANVRMRQIVKSHSQDKILLAFVSFFPTLWALVRLPYIGKLIAATSSLGTSTIFGGMLWRFQKMHRQPVPPKRVRSELQKADLSKLLPRRPLPKFVPPVDRRAPTSWLDQFDRKLLGKLGRVGLFGGFLLIYPMTTNSHAASATTVLSVCLASTSRLFRRWTSNEILEDAWEWLRTRKWIIIPLQGISLLFAVGYVTGYLFGRYAPGPLNIDLENICEPVASLLQLNRLLAISTGFFTGKAIWEVEEHLYLHRALKGKNRAPLDGLRERIDQMNLLEPMDRLHAWLLPKIGRVV